MVISNLKFSEMGAFWKFWTKIYCLRNVYRNVLCITDSLSHTTYVETNNAFKSTEFNQRLIRGLGSIPTRVTFFSNFYNPNLHNIARSDSLGFKTKNPNNVNTTDSQISTLQSNGNSFKSAMLTIT